MEAYGAEVHGLSPDRPPGSDTHETGSLVRCPVPMDVDTGVGTTAKEQGSSYKRLMFAEMVAGLSTSVFRYTPVEASSSVTERSPRLQKVSSRRLRPCQQYLRSLGLFA